jgi:hypothetical protein
MAIIRITTDEMFEIMQIPDDELKLAEIWEHIEKNGFLFNEYTLQVKGKILEKKEPLNVVYKVKINGYGDEQTIHVREIVHHLTGYRAIREYDTTVFKFIDDFSKVLKKNVGLDWKQWDVDDDSTAILVPMCFMRYCVDKAMNREIIEKPITQKRYKPINERSKSKKKTEYKLFEIIRKYEKHMNHNRHNMTCEHWEVKGHFRHYKSGKVVYIKPFSKGKNKNAKVENRVYSL